MFATFERTLSEERGYVYMVSELFVAGRHNPEILRELGALYSRARAEFAGSCARRSARAWSSCASTARRWSRCCSRPATERRCSSSPIRPSTSRPRPATRQFEVARFAARASAGDLGVGIVP